MHRIQAICLGHKEKFIDNYQSIEKLEAQVLEKYRKYLVQTNVKDIYVPFILAYKSEATGKEEVLTDINVIPKNNGRWFRLFVKRVCKTINQIILFYSDTDLYGDISLDRNEQDIHKGLD
ncbi:unnamed protein product [Rotaria sp. Silwood1]|nr:unnamed protein product [Rotaria sp. Silwood1]CAF1133504.1 unnamed protein product [Rotaria sp. Silwood1]